MMAKGSSFLGLFSLAMTTHPLRIAVASISMRLRPRMLNLILGAWLSASAFLFPHVAAQRVISLVSGIGAVSLALLARRSTLAHRAVAVVAFWLILSFFLFWPLPATAWSNTVVAVAMVCFATMDPERLPRRRRRGHSLRLRRARAAGPPPL
jgi:hypothetical protein